MLTQTALYFPSCQPAAARSDLGCHFKLPESVCSLVLNLKIVFLVVRQWGRCLILFTSLPFL